MNEARRLDTALTRDSQAVFSFGECIILRVLDKFVGKFVGKSEN